MIKGVKQQSNSRPGERLIWNKLISEGKHVFSLVNTQIIVATTDFVTGYVEPGFTLTDRLLNRDKLGHFRLLTIVICYQCKPKQKEPGGQNKL